MKLRLYFDYIAYTIVIYFCYETLMPALSKLVHFYQKKLLRASEVADRWNNINVKTGI